MHPLANRASAPLSLTTAPPHPADSFSTVDLGHLQFPAEYLLDYIRVYQPANALNLGCSPRDYPTQQYLAWCAAPLCFRALN